MTANFDAQLMAELSALQLPSGTMAVNIPVVRTTGGEIYVSNQLLSDRFVTGPSLTRPVRVRFWLRVRAIRVRESIAVRIAPWLRDADGW